MLLRRTKAREQAVVEESRAALEALNRLATSLEAWVNELCDDLAEMKETENDG